MGHREYYVLLPLMRITRCKKWKELWKLGIPPKVEIFIWRVTHNIIPTRKYLGPRYSSKWGCGVCKNGYETVWHIFINCSFAKGCCEAARLARLVGMARERTDNFSEFLCVVLNHN